MLEKSPALRSIAVVSLVSAAGLLSACNDNDSPSAFEPTPSPSPSPSPSPTPAPSGAVSTGFDVTTDKANDLRGLTFAASGKIYAAGHSDADPADRKIVVARFNADGSPDTAFAGDGFAEINVVAGGNEQTLSIAELADGNVVVAVNAADQNGGAPIIAEDNAAVTAPRPDGTSVYLIRLAADGTQVESFGDGGRAEVVFGWADADNGDWPLPIYNAASSGFSHAGFPTDTAWDLHVDASGDEEKLVILGMGSAAQLAGEGTQRVDNDRFVARVLASTGAADPDFNGGKAFTWATDGTLNDNARRGIVESDGSIVSAGYTNLGSGLGNHVIVLKVTPQGVLDTSFTGFGLDPVQNGVAVFNPFVADGGFAEAYGVSKQSNGFYVTTGYGAATASGTPSTLGYLTTVQQDLVPFRIGDGALDTEWGNDGTQAIQSESLGRESAEERGRHLTVLSDDRVIQVGYFAGTPAIYVLTEDGQLDSSVDGDGILEFPSATITQQFFAVAQSADGKRVAASTSSNANGARLVVLDIDL